MKALTIRQPWAQAIAFGVVDGRRKAIENRSWAPPAAMLGAEFLVHVSAKLTYDQALDDTNWVLEHVLSERRLPLLLGDELEALRRYCGQVICRVRLVGLVRAGVPVWSMAGREAYVREQAECPWFIGPYGWVLDVVEVYQPGARVRGALGLWDVPADVLSALEPLRA